MMLIDFDGQNWRVSIIVIEEILLSVPASKTAVTNLYH